MNAKKFVAELSKIRLNGVFNPYSDRCSVYDLADAPAVRRANLRGYLHAIEELETDTIWMGRDLGYRGGRRTGLALTDERHLPVMPQSYPGSQPCRATRGPAVAERTAAEIWQVILMLSRPPLLWNVFPFHPHEVDQPLSNRRFTSAELNEVDELNRALISWLKIRRIISIGQDAAKYAASFGVEVECVRHPSYGGVKDFRAGIKALYGPLMKFKPESQTALF